MRSPNMDLPGLWPNPHGAHLGAAVRVKTLRRARFTSVYPKTGGNFAVGISIITEPELPRSREYP
jgi:hypothetical protein